MSKITKIDPSACRQIRSEITPELERLMAEHGLSVEVGKMTYDHDHVSVKITVNVGSLEDKAQREFEQYADSYGLQPSDFGRTLVVNGSTYTVSGVSPRSPKRPILISRGGKTYKIAASMAVQKLHSKTV